MSIYQRQAEFHLHLRGFEFAEGIDVLGHQFLSSPQKIGKFIVVLEHYITVVYIKDEPLSETF